MSSLRAILVFALVLHPMLLRALPCGPLLVPDTAPGCCMAACVCDGGCGCAMDEGPTVPDAPIPAPATAPSGGDLRASLPPSLPVVTIEPAPLPHGVPERPLESRPFASCVSVNALHCIWTT